MAGLGEEVESSNTLNLVSYVLLLVSLHHDGYIASLGVNVAANVYNTTRLECQKLLEEVLRAALAGWINDQQSLVRWVGDILEEDGGIRGGKARVRQVIGLG